MDELIPWLMDGDPAIRWQTLRDLKGASAQRWQAEQLRTLRMLARMCSGSRYWLLN